MSWGAHVWISTEPLTPETVVIPLCQQEKTNPKAIDDVRAVALETSDIPVGSKLKVPEWCCRKCAKKAEELPKSEERMWAYAVTDSKYATQENRK